MGWDPPEAAPGTWHRPHEVQVPASEPTNVFVPQADAADTVVGTASAVAQARLLLEHRMWAEAGQTSGEDWSRAWPCSGPDVDLPVESMTWSSDVPLSWLEADFSENFGNTTSDYSVPYLTCEEGGGWRQQEWDCRDADGSLPDGSPELAQCTPGDAHLESSSTTAGPDLLSKTIGSLQELMSTGLDLKKQRKRRSHNVVPRSVNLAEQYASRIEDTAVTTLMLRNIPNTYSRRKLMGIIDKAGFQGKYDFLYLPKDSATDLNVGYAFVNFEAPDVAARFWKTMQGYTYPDLKKRLMLISVAHIQGIESNLEHLSVASVLAAGCEEHRPWFREPYFQQCSRRAVAQTPASSSSSRPMEHKSDVKSNEEPRSQQEVIAGSADMAGGPVAPERTDMSDECQAHSPDAGISNTNNRSKRKDFTKLALQSSSNADEVTSAGYQQARGLLDGILQITSPREAPSTAWEQYVGNSRIPSCASLASRGSAAPGKGHIMRSQSAAPFGQRGGRDMRAIRCISEERRKPAAADVSAGVALSRIREQSGISGGRLGRASRSSSKTLGRRTVLANESTLDDIQYAAAKEAASVAAAAVAARRDAEAWAAANEYMSQPGLDPWLAYGGASLPGPDPWYEDVSAKLPCPIDAGLADLAVDRAASMNSQAAPFTPGLAAWVATDGSMSAFAAPGPPDVQLAVTDCEPPACNFVVDNPECSEEIEQKPLMNSMADPKAVTWEVPVPATLCTNEITIQNPDVAPTSWEMPAPKAPPKVYRKGDDSDKSPDSKPVSWEVPAPKAPPKIAGPKDEAVLGNTSGDLACTGSPTQQVPIGKAAAKASQTRSRAAKAKAAAPAPPGLAKPPPGLAKEEEWPALGAPVGRQTLKHEAGRRRRVSRPPAKGVLSKKLDKPRTAESAVFASEVEAQETAHKESLQDAQEEDVVTEAPVKSASPAAAQPVQQDVDTEPSRVASISPPQYSRLQLLVVGARLGLLQSRSAATRRSRGGGVPDAGSEASVGATADADVGHLAGMLPVLASVSINAIEGMPAPGRRPTRNARSTSTRHGMRAPSARGSMGRRRSTGACQRRSSSVQYGA